MAIVSISDLPKAGVLIGIDPGKKTIGVAASDPERIVVTAVDPIQRGRKLGPALAELAEIIWDRDCVGLVIGLPLNMDGSRGPSAQAAFALVHQILKVQDLPAAMFDERLTTAQVERAMISADISRTRRAETIDSASAALILKSALNLIRNSP